MLPGALDRQALATIGTEELIQLLDVLYSAFQLAEEANFFLITPVKYDWNGYNGVHGGGLWCGLLLGWLLL
jgi:hypothetical protein